MGEESAKRVLKALGMIVLFIVAFPIAVLVRLLKISK